jgi:hypothetical protein
LFFDRIAGCIYLRNVPGVIQHPEILFQADVPGPEILSIFDEPGKTLRPMRRTLLTALTLIAASLSFGQGQKETGNIAFPQHYISVNPLNILLFQQAGISYEYKPGMVGFGLTAGYIYPNHKEYSNYFIAGPTSAGSLGDYSGFFVVPQLNLYLNRPKYSDHANLIYFALKPVYKYMQIDSTQQTAWSHPDDYYVNRKMNDRVDVYGGFIDFGYKYVIQHFFLNLEFGLGVLEVDHKMTISAEWISYSTENYYHPTKEESTSESHFTINFTLTLGGAF